MAQYKLCNKCDLEKNINEFSPRKVSKDGLRGQCKLCISISKKEYYKKNEKYLKGKAKNWRDNNKQKLKDNFESFLKLNHYSNLQPLCSYENRVNKRYLNN